MAEPRDFLDPAAVAQLDGLQVVARTLVEGFLRGLHLSSAKGSSIEFAELRPYVHGDEVRHIDWKTYGRTDRHYLRQYDDETNVRGTLVVDTSASMDFGTGGPTKLRYAQCLAAAIGYILLNQRDAVGLALVDSRIRRYVPPRATAGHLAGLYAVLESSRGEGQTELGNVLHRLAERAHRRSLIVLLSDLLDESESIVDGLAHLRQRGSEAIVFHLVDRAEVELPFTTWMVFRDPEHPGREVRLDARQARQLYSQNLQAHRELLRRGCTSLGVDYVFAETNQPFEALLGRYLHQRARTR